VSEHPGGWRRGEAWLATAGIAAVLSHYACRAEDRPADMDQVAMYAAEAGMEAAKLQLRSVCGDSVRLHAMQDAARRGPVAIPGLEQPTSNFLGRELPSGATMSAVVRTLTSGGDAPETYDFVVESWGQCNGTRRALQATLTCRASTDTAPKRQLSPKGPADHSP
jgi:hypothetical protein